MNSSMLSLLLLAILLIVAPLYPYIATYAIVVRHTFCPIEVELTDPTQMPSEIRDLMQPWIDRLQTFDFTVASYQRIHVGLIGQEPEWGVTLQHSSQQIFAVLLVKTKPDIRYPVLCLLSSYLAETNLITLNTKDFSTYSKTELERSNYLDRVGVDELYLGHQKFLSSICSNEDLTEMTADEWIARLERSSQEISNLYVKKGEAYWVDKSAGVYRKHPWLVLKMLVKIIIDRSKNNRSHVNRSSDLETGVDREQIELEIRNFLDRPKKSASIMSSNQRIWLLAGSFVIFIATYATHFRPVQLLIFILVLVCHELGHILAMVAFGYRDTAMLFIPWLGALATGHKENAALAERVWISLAGPLPGLIIGIALALAFPADSSWLKDASFMLIVLNLFNLMPIYPLDGGQVVDLLIFSRRPYLAVIFQSIGVLLLVTIGLAQPLMIIFAVLIALSIPHNFRLAKLRADFQKDFPNLPTEDREDLVRTIFHYLSTHKYRHLSFPLKTLLVDGLLDNQRQDRSNKYTRWGLTIFYAISLIGSFAIGVFAIFPTIGSFLVRGMVRESSHDWIERANRQLQKNPKDASAYVRRSWGYFLSHQYSAALRDVDRAILLDPNNSTAYTHRSIIRRQMGDLAGAETDAQQYQKLMWTSQLKHFDRTIQQNPNDISAYVERGNVKKMLGDKLGATADLQIALKLTPHSAADFIGRATLELDANNHKQAFINVNRALELEPENAEAYELRAKLHERMGDTKQAEIDRHKAETMSD